jgi:hypothetical protein
MSWTSRMGHPAGTPPLSQVQAAVENLADLFGVPEGGKTRIVFKAAADVALLGTVVVSGTLASVHLYRSLFRKPKDDKPTPAAAAGDGAPPRRNHRATASADGPEGQEEKAQRGR